MSLTDWPRDYSLSTARFRADFNAVRLAFVNHFQTPEITSMLAGRHLLLVETRLISRGIRILASHEQVMEETKYKS